MIDDLMPCRTCDRYYTRRKEGRKEECVEGNKEQESEEVIVDMVRGKEGVYTNTVRQ